VRTPPIRPDQHSSFDDAPIWAIELAWRIEANRERLDDNRELLDWIVAELRGEHKLRIAVTDDVITIQSEPTAPGPTSRINSKEITMPQTRTITLTATQVHLLSLGLVSDANGTPVPIPAGTTFAATSPSPAIGVVVDNAADTVAINALTLPSPNTASMAFDVTDATDPTVVALHVVVLYPVPVVDDITVTGDVVTAQPAPTTPGP
jgi:hypothetical protein